MKKYKIIKIEVPEGECEEKTLKLLNLIKTASGYGHSFFVVVDPIRDPSEKEPHVYWDGDGWDKIKSISIDVVV